MDGQCLPFDRRPAPCDTEPSIAGQGEIAVLREALSQHRVVVGGRCSGLGRAFLDRPVSHADDHPKSGVGNGRGILG
ncbi:hypothetical protein FQZ97_1000310 [compost metagenome]